MPVFVRRLAFGILVAIAALVPSAVLAQSVSSSVTGAIVDQTRQVLRGVTVTLVNELTGDSRTTDTNDAGIFVVSAVQPATYTLRIELSGFTPFERKHMVVPPQEQLSVGTIELKLGSLTEAVTTTAQGTFVETMSAERSALITSTQLELVADRGRDIASLLRILPGVSYQNPSDAPGGGFGSTTPNISGNRNSWNTMTVDGVVGNDLGSPQVFSSSINFDAIGEVQVQLSNYRAEYGGNGGPVVNIVTKSGSKDYKGSAYWYKRNEALNANNYFNKKNGVAKPLSRFDTVGGTFGGPVPLPKVESERDKLFFFYSFEGWHTLNPRALQQVTVPTALERAGDFSQSFDVNGRLIVITDRATGQPFPGNKIPARLINPSGQALLNIFPLPNALDRGITKGNYNYNFQESLNVPKRQNVLRIDYRASAKDSFYVRGSTWWADNQGYGVPAGSSAWGLVRLHYLFKDSSATANHTHIFTDSVVNELSVSVRHSTEDGPPLSSAELARVQRSNVGFTLGQLTPVINPLGIIPKVSFGSAIPQRADITYDGRLPLTGVDRIVMMNDTLTMTRGRHTYKAGMYAERDSNEEGQTGTFAGDFDFSRDPNNPFDTGYAYANALLGNFKRYTESTARPGAPGTAIDLEWFAQDTWRTTPRLTLDYGLRLAWYTHYRTREGASATFALERYDPAKAPVLFRPAIVNGVRVGYNPVTGAAVPAAFIGAIVPGTGDLLNGLVVGTDTSYPAGFKDQPPLLLEPRIGFAYDVRGDGRTAVRGSFGIFHNTLSSGNVNWQATRNPPLQFNPVVLNGTMDTLLQSSGVLFPSAVQGLERATRPPTLYSYSLGVQRDIGWGTVVDVAYVGSKGRRLLQTRNLNTIAYGARFLPANQDPTNNSPLPDTFLRPFPGYEDINFFENSGISNYNALQMQVNRRFVGGLQFGVAYTLSRSKDYTSSAETGTGSNMRLPLYQDPNTWSYGLSSFDQTHVAVINYTWDVPKASKLWDRSLIRGLLDNWQLSGITAFASGTPGDITFTTTDSADLTGGGDGTRVVVTGDPILPRDQRGFDQWFATSVFARPARGQIGNGRKDLIRRPGVGNWDLTVFKNIPLGGGRRRAQLRWEIYNLFNNTQFENIDLTARFDATGKQVNARFGQVTSTRQPRIMQLALRVVF